jgi:iron complex outermembrane receptor protein
MAHKLDRLVTVSALALGAAFVSAPAAMAQAARGDANQLSEVVVTAQRRSEKSLDVPISVSTLGAAQLAQAGVTTLSDISKLTPALRFDSVGSFIQPSIRGVGTSVTTAGTGPNVGIYVDGFFQSNAEVADFQLMNISNIQVLKGPQGTLFGRNTTGGAILVTSADPSTTPGGQFKASYGSYNARTLQGYATTGIGDKVAVDLEALYRGGDGFQRNIVTGTKHPGVYDDWSVRAGLKAELTDRITLLLRYQHSETNDPSTLLANSYVDNSGEAGMFKLVSAAGQAVYGRSSSAGLPLVNLNIFKFLPNFIATAPNDISTNLGKPIFRNKSDTFQGTLKADLGFADLTSYTQYRKDNSVNLEDLDTTGVPGFEIHIGVKDETISQEFLLNSKPGTRLQWTAGLNYFRDKDDWNDIQGSIQGFNPAHTAKGYGPFGGASTTPVSEGAFADLTYEVLPSKFFVTVGGRFSHDQVDNATFKTNPFTTAYTGPQGQSISVIGDPPGTVIPGGHLAQDSFTPRVVLRYKPTDTSSVYASYSRGYKAGILNVGALSQVPVNPEINDAYEVGYKFSERQFSFDLAGYYDNYKNLQVSSYNNGALAVTNAASAEIYGVEGQVRYRVDSHLDFDAGAAWTHARYTSFKNAPAESYCDPTVVAPSNPMFCSQGAGGITQTAINASGFHMQRSPDFTASLGANYRFEMLGGDTTLSGNFYYTSKFYFDPTQQSSQDAYGLLSLHAEWVDPSRRYTVAVYGDNVTGQRYRTQVLPNTTGFASVWAAPATWGVSVGAKF